MVSVFGNAASEIGLVFAFIFAGARRAREDSPGFHHFIILCLPDFSYSAAWRLPIENW